MEWRIYEEENTDEAGVESWKGSRQRSSVNEKAFQGSEYAIGEYFE